MKQTSRKGTFWQRFWKDRQLYLFMLVPVIYIVVFEYVPIAGLSLAFKHYMPAKGIVDSPWVGFANFTKFFKSYQFGRVVPNTLILSLYSIVASFPVPIIFALMLNSLDRPGFKKVSANIVNMPHFISVVVVVGILMQMLNPRTGLYGTIMMKLTGSYPSDPFRDASLFRHLYVWSGVWQGFGWSSIIYTAALSNVSPELHDAAQIDGASRFQRVIHVDFPYLLPTIIIMLILKCGHVMSIGFEKVFLMQNTLNLSVSQVISTYVYKIGIAGDGAASDISYATAIGFFNSLINLILIVAVNKISSKVSETSLW